MREQVLPSVLIIISTIFFFSIERVFPGRELPKVRGWYFRAILINLIQLGMIGLAGLTWNLFFRNHALYQMGGWNQAFLEGLFYWFIGTFVFYWWHRLRHASFFWQLFHQLHHSPRRIEALTSFYKHPVEIAADSILIGAIIYSVFGGSAEAGAWYSFYAATGEYFYHSNIKTPSWVGYFIQRPEHHSVHHQLDVHKYNFSDITWWDRIFGTFKDTETFVPECGFPNENEKHFAEILKFKDVYRFDKKF
jgi:sterol desaturase/sphingolipid hydroxylase (fatty acid hydroxylase superfamily)